MEEPMKRSELVHYLDEFLKISSFEDSSKNGLQVEGRAEVTHIAMAVDACLEAFQRAGEVGADFLLVHHGLFWESYHPLVGVHLRRIRALLERDLSLYAAHLPLDAHPEVGNNATLTRMLGLEVVGPFGEYKGMTVGLEAQLAGEVSTQEFAALVQERLGIPVVLQPYGPPWVTRVGIVSGGAASMIGDAARHGLDLYLTGERSHTFFHEAAEHGIHVVYAGHYATEKVGPQALGRHLEERFGLQTTWIELPTGL
jgi:dinuclear metal center YbgI/SA1388 family protein